MTSTASGPASPAVQTGDAASKDHTVRIGIVLPGDCRQSVALVLPAGHTFTLSAADRTESIRAVEDLPIEVSVLNAPGSEPVLVINLQTDSCSVPAGDAITIEYNSRQELIPGDGIRLHQVLAGRSFHWRKEIDQSLPGTLRFYLDGNFIVVVNELPVEWYVAAAVTAEMSGNSPFAFLKAQAVAVRSWSFFNRPGKHGALYTHCNDDCCQRYQGTGSLTSQAIKAVTDTRGEVLINDFGGIVNTFYSKCCGGIMSQTSASQGKSTSPIKRLIRRKLNRILQMLNPALRHKFDQVPAPDTHPVFPKAEFKARKWIAGDWPELLQLSCNPDAFPQVDLGQYLGSVDEQQSWFRWSVSFSQKDLAQVLQASGDLKTLETVTKLEAVRREPSGRLTRLKIHFTDHDGSARTYMLLGEYTIRKSLARTFLYSSAFVVDHLPSEEVSAPDFVFHGAGWGHGLGLCQMGALGMALKGLTYEEILRHYFSRARLHMLETTAGPWTRGATITCQG